MSNKTTRKHGIFYAIGATFLFAFVEAFIFGICLIPTNQNIPLAFIIMYIILIYILFICYKKTLIEDFKDIKNKLNIKTLKYIGISFVFILLTFLSNYLISKYFNNIAQNEIKAEEMLLNSKFLMSINICILGPIAEELIFRYPYRNIKTKKIISFIVYTTIFALFHITSFIDIVELLSIVTYIFVSIAIGFIFYKTDNIYLSMFMHILNNVINVILIIGG